jgi:hypothetical protein
MALADSAQMIKTENGASADEGFTFTNTQATPAPLGAMAISCWVK